MWSLQEIIVQNNPELAGDESEYTKATKSLNRRNALLNSATDELLEEEWADGEILFL